MSTFFSGIAKKPGDENMILKPGSAMALTLHGADVAKTLAGRHLGNITRRHRNAARDLRAHRISDLGGAAISHKGFEFGNGVSRIPAGRECSV
jgi:hypothetical protein